MIRERKCYCGLVSVPVDVDFTTFYKGVRLKVEHLEGYECSDNHLVLSKHEKTRLKEKLHQLYEENMELKKPV